MTCFVEPVRSRQRCLPKRTNAFGVFARSVPWTSVERNRNEPKWSLWIVWVIFFWSRTSRLDSLGPISLKLKEGSLAATERYRHNVDNAANNPYVIFPLEKGCGCTFSISNAKSLSLSLSIMAGCFRQSQIPEPGGVCPRPILYRHFLSEMPIARASPTGLAC